MLLFWEIHFLGQGAAAIIEFLQVVSSGFIFWHVSIHSEMLLWLYD